MNINILNDLNEEEKIWVEAESNNLDKNIFVSYVWVKNYWEYYKKKNKNNFMCDKKLCIYVAKDGAEVVFILPLALMMHNILGYNICKLQFIAHPHANYNSFIMTNYKKSKKALDLILLDINKNLNNVNCFTLSDIPENSYSKMILDSQFETRNFDSRLLNNSYYVNLPDSYELYLQNLGKNMRRNIKRWNKKAEKYFNVTFLKYDEIGSIEESLKLFYELHRIRFPGTSIFNNMELQDFHHKIANDFAEKDMLELFFLMFDGEPVSAVFGYEYYNKLYDYSCCHNPYFAKFSPGRLAFSHLLQYSIKKGYNEFDFLRGDYHYKKLYGVSTRKSFDYNITTKNTSKLLQDTLNNPRVRRFITFTRRTNKQLRESARWMGV